MDMLYRVIYVIKKIILVGITFLLLGLSNLMIRLLSFKKLLMIFVNSEGSFNEVLLRKVKIRIKIIGRTIQEVSSITPWRSMCFEQAITATLLLRALGISSTIYFGIRKNENGELEAHAWTKAGDQYVTGMSTMNLFTPVLVRSYQCKGR